MATRTLAYECMYCGTLKRNKNICERHELTCFRNPEAKNCVLCVHMNSETKTCRANGKRCSTAVSAACEDFVRRETNE